MLKTIQSGDFVVAVVDVDVHSDGSDCGRDKLDSFNKKLHIRKIIFVNIIVLIMIIMTIMTIMVTLLSSSREEEEAGDSPHSSTSTAATLPLPGPILYKTLPLPGARLFKDCNGDDDDADTLHSRGDQHSLYWGWDE